MLHANNNYFIVYYESAKQLLKTHFADKGIEVSWRTDLLHGTQLSWAQVWNPGSFDARL